MWIKSVLTTGVAALALAGCGGDSGPRTGQMMAPAHLSASNYRAFGVPSHFGDTDPHEWEGLTPAHYPVHGIDAARYQGRINWPEANAAGVNFAWLKATEGGDWVDPGFQLNAQAARAAGVPVGGYHFYYFCRSPEEQANWYIRNVPRIAGDLPPVLDIEWNHQSRTCKRTPSPATVQAEMRRFLEIVTQHYGARPVIYTTPDFYEENALGSLDGYEFWLRSVAAHPTERYPGEQWSFWQYTGTGVVPGVGGTVDINTFAGSPEAWMNWLATRRL